MIPKLGEPLIVGGHHFGRVTSLVRRDGVLVQIGATKGDPHGRAVRSGFVVLADGALHLLELDR